MKLASESAWQTYNKNYEKARKKATALGYEMQEKKLKRRDWELRYRSLYNDIKAEGKEPKNINRIIINDQTYNFSQKQASKALKYYKETLGSEKSDITLQDIRRLPKKDPKNQKVWDKIRDLYHQKKEELGSWEEADNYLSKYIFESP